MSDQPVFERKTRRNVLISRFLVEQSLPGSHSCINDLWLDISLTSPQYEEALVYVIYAILSERYA